MAELLCEVGGHPFTLTAYEESLYARFGFTPASICFPHQHQWRLAFRGDRTLHRRNCDLTGKPIISIYPADAVFPVYEREAWYSDAWDATLYGRDFDFNRPFFEQYGELLKVAPRMALSNVNAVNSEYCNSTVGNKNCYLIFGGDYNEDSMFGSLPMNCKDCVDCDWTTACELCYFCAYSEHCYNCQYTFNSKNCSDCFFIEDCIGSRDCILSFNLQNKQYYIENQPYSKEEYEKKKAELLSASRSQMQSVWQRFLTLRGQRGVKFAHTSNCENVAGELIFNSKNCHGSYECIDSEETSECWTTFKATNCFNSDYIGHHTQLSYNNIATFSSYDVKMSYWTVHSSQVEYSEFTISSKNIFGCIGMRTKENCILNKQYSSEEFINMRARIIEHMQKTGEFGRFFPRSLSTFSYADSTASTFMPLSTEEALASGFRVHQPEPITIVDPYTPPDSIHDIGNDLLERTIVCEKTGKPFRITQQELAFYKRNAIPVPLRHPDQRYRDRLDLRNSYVLYSRICSACGTGVQSSYSPDRSEQIYCEPCYQSLVLT